MPGKVKVEGLSENQHKYIHDVRNNAVTICQGPAGVGKTYIACGMAMQELTKESSPINKIVLTRPNISCGPELGFLPGDLSAKMIPWLRPLYDEISKFTFEGGLLPYLDSEMIEIAPLSYMRGRTFKNAFVILDEAQNATYPELKMFFTRIGIGSKMVVNGDPQQRDIYDTSFQRITNQLSAVKGVAVCQLERKDNARHGLIPDMLEVMVG